VSYFSRMMKWDDAAHPRGKTTPESNDGSFAPTADKLDHKELHARAIAMAYPHLSKKIRDGGETGWQHSQRVAAQFEDHTLKLIAYLHDLVEDSPVTVEEIRTHFGVRVAAAVDALTKRNEGGTKEPLEHYLARVVANPDALRVKVADMSDNMHNVSEAARSSPHLQAKHRGYKETYPKLQAALNGSFT